MFVVIIFFMLLLFFFFKQKTAYEMRISDWSSDVCSSDLSADLGCTAAYLGLDHALERAHLRVDEPARRRVVVELDAQALHHPPDQIGRASCRDRVCQYV